MGELTKAIQNRIDTNNFFTNDIIGLSLLISKEGLVEKITIKRGHNQDSINEAIRVVNSFNKWTPAIYEFYPTNNSTSTYNGKINMLINLRMEK